MEQFAISFSRVFSTQGSNPDLLHCRQILYHLSHEGSPSEHNAAAAKSLQSCLTLCDPTDGNPPGSAVPGILQARTLEWVAISFSNAWKGKDLAFYEAYGLKGMESFVKTVKYLKEKHPHHLIIADAKRGDIGNTSQMYARTFFEEYDVDALTVAENAERMKESEL